MPMIPGTQSLVLGIIRNELCMDLVNLASATAGSSPLIPTPGATTINDSSGGYVSYRYAMSNGNASGTPVCGAITMRQPDTTPTTIAGIRVDMASVQSSVFMNVLAGSIRPAVATIAQQVWTTKKPDALSGLNAVYTNAVAKLHVSDDRGCDLGPVEHQRRPRRQRQPGAERQSRPADRRHAAIDARVDLRGIVLSLDRPRERLHAVPAQRHPDRLEPDLSGPAALARRRHGAHAGNDRRLSDDAADSRE